LENIASLIRQHTLPAGAKVALLPRKTRGESVVFQLSMRYGTEKALWDKRAVADLTGAMLMRGSQKYNRQALQDRLDELQANARINGGISGTYASVLTTKANLEEVVDLVAEVLRNPVFDPKELELL